MTTNGDLRTALASCRACTAHLVGTELVLRDAANIASQTTGSSAHKWMRHYFARFHEAGHRRVA